eukprot:394364-Pyramimonas_sp.AAC.1
MAPTAVHSQARAAPRSGASKPRAPGPGIRHEKHDASALVLRAAAAQAGKGPRMLNQGPPRPSKRPT